ncbi:MAG: hypothetical protein M3Q87_01865 [Actinomycetota bacterium]|nr:hypothetical protein [Actinomycetota bacterium]
MGSTATAGRAGVVLSVPAAGVYVSVIRTAAAGLGARLDFTLDNIEDLRIAVDEACVLLLEQAQPGSDITVEFTLGDEDLRVRAAVPCDHPRVPSQEGFSWTVLAALTTGLAMEVDGSDLVIVLDRSRGDDT